MKYNIYATYEATLSNEVEILAARSRGKNLVLNSLLL